jgi:nuclease-like protein
MRLRYAGVCASCAVELAMGVTASWYSDERVIRCLTCAGESGQPASPGVVFAGQAGESARREHARRTARREQEIRRRHPRIGGLILALSEDPASTRVWAQGAAGEEAVGSVLDGLAPEYLHALHDRRMRDGDGRLTRANIDHIAVTASGVWVVDAKTHRGGLEVRRSGGLFGPRRERLFIRGRDQTDLVLGLAKQVAVVRVQLEALTAGMPVRGALCFVGTELPLFGETIGDVPLVGRRGLAKLVKRAGPLPADYRARVADMLNRRFPPR